MSDIIIRDRDLVNYSRNPAVAAAMPFLARLQAPTATAKASQPSKQCRPCGGAVKRHRPDSATLVEVKRLFAEAIQGNEETAALVRRVAGAVGQQTVRVRYQKPGSGKIHEHKF